MSDAISQAASILGEAGGKAGKGEAKRRSASHYARISRLGGEATRRKFKGNAKDRRKAERALKMKSRCPTPPSLEKRAGEAVQDAERDCGSRL